MLLIFLRLVYVYFQCKENTKSLGVDKKIDENIEDIKCLYMDLKFKTMTEDDTFDMTDFMDYAIFRLLDLKPSKRFIRFIRALLQ
jgi:hypothetical protein